MFSPPVAGRECEIALRRTRAQPSVDSWAANCGAFVSKVEDIEKDEPMAKKATAKKPVPKSKPAAKAAKGKR
jgi:hypothetical protein